MKKHTLPVLPPIGMRIIKSAIAVALCYVIQLFRGDSGIVFYSQLSALWCMQSYISTTRKNAIQRTIGTILGALFGLIVLLIVNFAHKTFNLSELQYYTLKAVVISVAIIPLLWLTVVLKKKQASYFSCVVFLSIVVIHLADENCYFFVWNRFLDTMIGIVIGVFVNLFHLPRKQHKEILFISGLDDTLLNSDYHLNDYCKVELNRMLDKGLNFMEPMKDIRLKLPVIAMDGAVLYDTQKKHYLAKIEMSLENRNKVLSILDSQHLTYFANVVIDDTLLIYYTAPDDAVQTKLIEELRVSPYRNYIRRPLPENENVVYFMLIYPSSKTQEIYDSLVSQGISQILKVITYPSKDYPGYSYIKIFDQSATRQNMIEYFKRQLGVSQTVTFGTIPGLYDYVVPEGNTNKVVHILKKLFE